MTSLLRFLVVCRTLSFWLAIFWSAFSTVLLAVAGIKLPGLNFKSQLVEAAYRKELVYGEDHRRPGAAADRSGARFSRVRKN